MPIPMFIPMGSGSPRDCILVEGVKYCESMDTITNDLGWMLLGLLAFGIWIGMWMWISERFFGMNLAVALGGAIGLPLLIGGITLVLI